MANLDLLDYLNQNTQEGELYEKRAGSEVRCFACSHRCFIPEGKTGICRIRFNRGGKLYVPAGYVGALQDDPIEKKPFFHALPGARAMSFGMIGCNFHCAHCQNWITSQALQDPKAKGSQIYSITPKELADLALARDCRIVTSTYNEPLISSEWAVAIFKEAKKAGLVTSYVSNGNATLEVLDYLRPWLDLFKVDLKCFDERHYRELGGTLENITESIRGIFQRGFWLEIVTLLIPGFNDSDRELARLTEFIASVSPDIPWHVTAFHADYKMTENRNTTAEDLLRAAEIGRQSGLHYIYAGNLPSKIGSWENTYCPECHELLIERRGFQILKDRLTPTAGLCQKCKTKIPGFWKTCHPRGSGDL